MKKMIQRVRLVSASVLCALLLTGIPVAVRPAEAYAGVRYVTPSGVGSRYTGLAKASDGVWYYLRNGRQQTGYTGLVKYGSTWYYVNRGRVDWKARTIAQVNNRGTWYFVRDGRIDWKYTGLVKYGSRWYYVKNGRVDWSYTGLAKNGSWYYVKNGRVDWSYTGLSKLGNTWYYVGKGKLDRNYTGPVKYGWRYYYVRKGVLDNSVINDAGLFRSCLDPARSGGLYLGDEPASISGPEKADNSKDHTGYLSGIDQSGSLLIVRGSMVYYENEKTWHMNYPSGSWQFILTNQTRYYQENKEVSSDQFISYVKKNLGRSGLHINIHTDDGSVRSIWIS